MSKKKEGRRKKFEISEILKTHCPIIIDLASTPKS
jgi:hypothetical protein